MINLFNWVGMIFDLMAGILGLFYLSKSDFLLWCNKHVKFKRIIYLIQLVLLLCSLGVISQSYRFWITIDTGISPTDNQIPIYILKDFGINLMIFTVAYWGYLYNKKSEL
jgi:hypothetical protein